MRSVDYFLLCCAVSRCDTQCGLIFCCVARYGLFSVALRSVALRCDAQYGLFSVALRGCAVLPVRLCSVIRGMHYFLLRCTMLHCTALRSVA